MFSKQSKKEVKLIFSLLWEIHSERNWKCIFKVKNKIRTISGYNTFRRTFFLIKKECINRRLHQTDLLTVVIMYVSDCFNSFLEDFPVFKTMHSSRMWISYGIISDKNICKTLTFLRGKMKDLVSFSFYICGLFFPEIIKNLA